jgi:hypothetical protein
VVDAFMKVMGASGATQVIQELAIQIGQAKPGMVLSRDLISTHGELLLSKDFRLDAALIGQIKSFDPLGDKLIIYIYDKK